MRNMQKSQETLKDSDIDENRRTSQFQLDNNSIASASTDLDLANDFYTSRDNDLNVVQNRERVSNRPVIPATKCEKLTFIRSYMSSMGKTDILGIQVTHFNELFWDYLQGVFMKTLPSCYIHLFLGSYAKEHHLFLAKMAPLMHGVKILWILIAMMQLFLFTNSEKRFLDFIVTGVLNDHPWNRCSIKDHNVNITTENGTTTINVQCYTLDHFIKRTANNTIITRGRYFYDQASEQNFLLSHHFHSNWDVNKYTLKKFACGITMSNIYDNIIWILSSALINQIFKKHIWKILSVAHWLLAGVLACILLFFLYFAAINEGINEAVLQPVPTIKHKMGLDLIMLAESLTTPPLLHILTSRSKEEVKLSADSALLVTSNTVFYLFRAYVVDQLLKYCVFFTKTQLHSLSDTYFNIEFLWPVFFWSIHMERIFTIPFAALILFVDFLTFTITHQCLIEILVCEWQFIRRWQAAVLFCVLNNIFAVWPVVIYWFMVYGIHVTTYTELLIITILYPLGRFIEDVRFHNGIAPSYIITIGFRAICLYDLIKIFQLSRWKYYIIDDWNEKIILVVIIILLLAFLIKIYDITSKKKDWRLIFVPVQGWGPLDLTLRLLRKKFDSSKYIASQAPRDLSRYLLRKAEPKSYRLNVRYDVLPKSMQFLQASNYFK